MRDPKLRFQAFGPKGKCYQIEVDPDPRFQQTGPFSVLAKKKYTAAPGDHICPPIYVPIKKASFDSVVEQPPVETTLRSVLEQKGYSRIVEPNAISIRAMGELGEGAFATRNIQEGEIIAVHSGLHLMYQHIGYEMTRHETYIRTADYQNCMLGGLGNCAADKVQHASPREDFKDTLPGQAFPNTHIEEVTIGHTKSYLDIKISIIRADRDIAKDEILLINYGLQYISKPDRGMSKTTLFNKYGRPIGHVPVYSINIFEGALGKVQPITEPSLSSLFGSSCKYICSQLPRDNSILSKEHFFGR